MEKKTKEQLQEELRALEREEEKAKEDARRQKNYEKFKARKEDWMIGRAHADMDFIGERYFSDMRKPMIPVSVSVSGSCGVSYYPEALLTNSTKTYFHNVWEYQDRNGFQERLNAFVQKEIEAISRSLHNVLEMMGLQSDNYHITSEFYPADKLNEIWNDVEKARWEILDRYEDTDFLALLKERTWHEKGAEDEETKTDISVDLSHSRMILYRYIFNNRPAILDTFKETKFYEQWKDRIGAKKED